MLIRRVSHRPRRRQRSSRRQLEHRPVQGQDQHRSCFLICASGKPSQICEGSSHQEWQRPARSPVVESDSIPLGKCLWRRRCRIRRQLCYGTRQISPARKRIGVQLTSGGRFFRMHRHQPVRYVNTDVIRSRGFLTITSFRRISAMMDCVFCLWATAA